MEFKDRLKQKRVERQLSQQKLADEIYVSRSAVAKWENGLGIPNETSYAALLSFFELTEQELPLNEAVEAVSVGKNRKIRRLTVGVAVLSVAVLLMAASFFLLVLQDDFAFTSRAAVDPGWEDELCLRTPDYDFYVKCTADEPWRGWVGAFRVVERRGIGYRAIWEYEECYSRGVYEDGRRVGELYVFAGEGQYYYIIPASTRLGKSFSGKTDELIARLSDITVEGEAYNGWYNSIFVLPFELTEFSAAGRTFTVQ